MHGPLAAPTVTIGFFDTGLIYRTAGMLETGVESLTQKERRILGQELTGVMVWELPTPPSPIPPRSPD